MADGTEIAWTRLGSGPPVVMVHGITENSASWGAIPGMLAADFEVITVDLRGHGRSGTADDYGLSAMVGDIAAVIVEAGLSRPHLVGHSLGGAVVSAVGASLPVGSVVNVDQQLRLAEFKAQLEPVETMLRDPEAFPGVIGFLFEALTGDMLTDSEKARLDRLRRPDQAVVLGAWQLIFESSVEEIDSIVDAVLAEYKNSPVPYLALFGTDPGPTYGQWLSERIPNMELEVWPDHGHYPHLVEPSRFVARLRSFWTAIS